MRKQRRSGGFSGAMIGVIVVLILLSAVIGIGRAELIRQKNQYAAQEESLSAAIAEENQRSEQLKQQETYVTTKEYIIDKAREIFGLKMPDEYIVEPEQK